MSLAAVVAALLLLPAPVSVRTSPPRGFAPLDVRVIATVERDALNRRVTITIDGEHYFQAFDVTLEGESAPRTIEYTYRHALPAGTYRVSAEVTRADRKPPLFASYELTVFGEAL